MPMARFVRRMTAPESTSSLRPISCSSVVFPAPFAPIRPTFSAGLIWKETSRSTAWEPKDFETSFSCTSTIYRRRLRGFLCRRFAGILRDFESFLELLVFFSGRSFRRLDDFGIVVRIEQLFTRLQNVDRRPDPVVLNLCARRSVVFRNRDQQSGAV